VCSGHGSQARLVLAPTFRTSCAKRCCPGGVSASLWLPPARTVFWRATTTLGYRGVSAAEPMVTVDWHLDPVHNRRPQAFWPMCRSWIGHWRPQDRWAQSPSALASANGRALWLTATPGYGCAIASAQSWLRATRARGVNWKHAGARLPHHVGTWALHFLFGDPGQCPEAREPRNVQSAWLTAWASQLRSTPGCLNRKWSAPVHDMVRKPSSSMLAQLTPTRRRVCPEPALRLLAIAHPYRASPVSHSARPS